MLLGILEHSQTLFSQRILEKNVVTLCFISITIKLFGQHSTTLNYRNDRNYSSFRQHFIRLAVVIL